jgi:dihydropteroate synthase
MILQCGERRLDLAEPRVMGVLNVTPDSFSDGGQLLREGAPALDRVLRRAARMLREGAAVLDVGGESTRPGAAQVPEQQELDRVLPVVEALAARFDTVISVDTSTPRVMREAVARGAGMINDVRALRRPGALEAAAAGAAAVCLMHMQGEPGTMQQEPRYADVVAEVDAFLAGRVAACRDAGIDAARLVLDPGFGFGKTLEHNLALFRGLDRLVARGLPVLVGVSRKSMIGRLLGREVRRRLPGGLALATLAVAAGARLVRAHDVGATRDAVAIAAAVVRAGGS